MICVKSISVYPSSVSIEKGKWYHGAKATVSPSNATCCGVVWSSSNTSVATVNKNSGYIYAVSAGTAKIYATATDGSKKNDYITVTVTSSTPSTPSEPQKVSVTSVSVKPSSITMDVGDSEYLSATVQPTNATNKCVGWHSSNSSVVTVNPESGLVMAQKSGTAIIYATACDGSGNLGRCTVTVRGTGTGTGVGTGTGTTTPSEPQKVLVTSVSVDPSSMTMDVGESKYFSATVAPSNATNKCVGWHSSNSSVVTVNPESGLVMAQKSGTATIYATACDGSGNLGRCTVTVTGTGTGTGTGTTTPTPDETQKVLVTSVSVEPSSMTMNVGDSEFLSASVKPANATNKCVCWQSNNSRVATVNPESGYVIAHNPGTATIYATACDGSGRYGTCTITVEGTGTGSTTPTPTPTAGSSMATAIELPLGDEKKGCICCPEGAVWYKFTANDPALSTSSYAKYNVTLTSSENMTVSLYTDTNNSVPFYEWERNGNVLVKSAKLSSGCTYYVVVEPANQECGNYTICVNGVDTWVSVTSVEIAQKSVTLPEGHTQKLTAIVKPDDATNRNVAWMSADSSLARVSAATGVVEAKKGSGSVKIYAAAEDRPNTVRFNDTSDLSVDECEIVLADANSYHDCGGNTMATAQDLELNKEVDSTIKCKNGEDWYKFTATLTGEYTISVQSDFDSIGYLYDADGEEIACNDDGGTNNNFRITAELGMGTYYVRVKSFWPGSGDYSIKLTYTLGGTTNVVPVTSVCISHSTKTLVVGESVCLEATVYPANATNPNISWTSDDCNIAEVDSNGCVTAKSEGTTYICANAIDGSGVHDRCEVTVEVSIHEEMVSALCTKEDCYVRLDTIISNTTANDTRLKKSSGGSVVLRASTSDTVQLLQSAKITDSNGEDWYQILYNGMIAYVTADSFDVTTMPKPTFYAVKNMVVNTGDGSNLNVRNKPYITGNLIGKFADQTIVQLMNSTPQNGNWYPVYGQLNNGNYSYGWCSGDYLTDVEDNNLSESQIQEILTNIQNCSTSTIPSNRKEAAVATAQAMLHDGYAPAFVAGMIANIVFEGATGQFESSKYVSTPSAKPDYLVYMDTQYAGTDYYLNNYSGKTIMDVNVQNVYSMLHSLKTTSNDTWRINGSRVGFGLGSIQWTFSRAYTLVQLYLEVNNNQSSISKTQAIEAEKLMIMRELKSAEYRGIVNTWRNKCDNINSADAANIAGSDLCNSYLRPADSTQAQKRATRAEAIYSAMMNSIG